MPVIPNPREEEFMAREELERRKRLAQEREARLEESQRRAFKELHWMRCPKCGMEMVEIGFKGMLLDQCSGCNGVYLDAGELDALQAQAEQDAGLLGTVHRLLRR